MSSEAAQPAVCLCDYLGLFLPGFPGELLPFLEGRGFLCQKHTEHCSEHSLLSCFYTLFILLTLGVPFGWHFSDRMALRETTLLVFPISRFKLCSFFLCLSPFILYHHLSFLVTPPWQFSYLQIPSQTSPRCLQALLPRAAHGFIYKPSKDLGEKLQMCLWFGLSEPLVLGRAQSKAAGCRVEQPLLGEQCLEYLRELQSRHHRCLHTSLALALLFSSHIMGQRLCLAHLGFISI